MKTKPEQAYLLGVLEFQKGGTLIPYQCKALTKLLVDLEVGTMALEIMNAFQRGFIAA
jgi:hypothetical protein